MPDSKARTVLRFLLRILLTAGFLYLVFLLVEFRDHEIWRLPDQSKVVVREGEKPPEGGALFERREGLVTLARRADRGLALLLAALLTLPMGLLAVRWWYLMRVTGVPAPFRRVLAVSYAGAFLNLFLPGMAGGDLAKAVLATRGEERKAAVVGTILLDRVIGLSAMILMAVAAVLPQVGRPELRMPVILVLSLLAAGIAGLAIYFSPLLRRTRFGTWLKSRLPFLSALREMDGVFREAKSNRRAVALSFAISLAAQATAIVLIYGLARSLGIREVPLAQFFLFEPILFIVTAMPISLGGWGVGEYAYSFLFGTVGVPVNQAVALSVLYKIATMVASLPGGVLIGMGWAGRRIHASTTESHSPLR